MLMKAEKMCKPDEEWSKADDVTNTLKLWDRLQSKEYVKVLTEYNCVILAIGTEEIMDGSMSGTEVFDMIHKIANHLIKYTSVNVKICQPPPTHVKSWVFASLNSMIRKHAADNKKRESNTSW